MAKQYGAPKNEWSHTVSVEELSHEPKTYKFEADEQERIDLARRFGILAIERAEAAVTLQRVDASTVQAIGYVKADLTQACVVSLAPMPVHVEDEFEGWFGDKTKAVSFARAKSEREAQKGHTEAEILEESIDPEPILGGKLDIGELATQYLSLALDPYPQAEGVERVYTAEPPSRKGSDGEGAEFRRSPFEALKDWKEKR